MRPVRVRSWALTPRFSTSCWAVISPVAKRTAVVTLWVRSGRAVRRALYLRRRSEYAGPRPRRRVSLTSGERKPCLRSESQSETRSGNESELADADHVERLTEKSSWFQRRRSQNEGRKGRGTTLKSHGFFCRGGLDVTPADGRPQPLAKAPTLGLGVGLQWGNRALTLLHLALTAVSSRGHPQKPRWLSLGL